MGNTYTDVVPLQWKGFEWRVVTWNVAKYLVGSTVPFDSVEPLVFQSKRAIEDSVLSSQQCVWNFHSKVAQSARRH